MPESTSTALLTVLCTLIAGLFVFLLLQWRSRQRKARQIAELRDANQRLETRALELAQQMTRELEAGKARHHLIMAGAGICFWDWDLGRDEVHFEGSLGEGADFGFDGDRIPSNVWFRAVHSEDQAGMWALLDGHMRGKAPVFEAEYRVVPRDRQPRWVMARAVVVERSADGAPTRLSGTLVDIETRKQVEMALEQERRLFNSGPVIVIRIRLDDAPTYTYFSSNVYELWGYPSASLDRGCRRADLVHPDDLERTLATYREVIASGGRHLQTELRYRMHDESYRWHSLYGKVVRGSDPPELVGYLIDIEDRKQVDQEIASQKAMLEELVVNLRDSEHERTLLHQTGDMLNSAKNIGEACAIVQRTAQVMFPGWSGAISTSDSAGHLTVRDQWGGVVTQRLLPSFGNEQCWALRRGRSHTFLDGRRSVPCQHVDCSGELQATLCVPMVADGKVVGALHLMADAHVIDGEVVRTMERAERLGETLKLSLSNLGLRASLQEQAIRDGLTGLYNRRLLAERLPAELVRCQRTSQPLMLAMMDIDHFKRFNDTYGHEAGDLVLHAVARCINESVRGYDLACRYGGEEFCIVLPGCSLDAAMARLQAMRQLASTLSLRHAGQVLPVVTLSGGLAVAGPESAEQLVARADAALYAAKAAGRDCVMVADGDVERVVQPAASLRLVGEAGNR
ncbi:MAG: diguanylate cyclase [Rhodocyclaceae bacterium]|nr:diguanylate cyclase [Rhodocyclaceae bacterium]